MIGDLVAQAEDIRVQAVAGLDSDAQGRLGQYFTPHRAAELIAGMPSLSACGQKVRVLDPGAGSGMLVAALVQRLAVERPDCSVHVTAIEVDKNVVVALEATAERCRQWASGRGLAFKIDVRHEDFIQANTGLGSVDAPGDFDLVIMNPPYAKLPTNSPYRQTLLAHGVDCPNLYAAFLALGIAKLRPGGQLAAITPRSFANGPYFERFRTFFLRSLTVDRVHTFASRSTVFSDTGVLQENLVFSGTRGGEARQVRFTISHDHTDKATEHIVDYDELVRPGDPHRFLRITTSIADTIVSDTMAAMPMSLMGIGLSVSTGKVVDFRSRGNLCEQVGAECTPLIYPGNIRNGIVEWPRSIRKAQGFSILTEVDRKMLVPAGCYVVVKRFSAKEERRRIVAAVWDPAINGDSPVAFENHLNVFHKNGAGLDRSTAVGLSLWLNSTVVDRYFRTFSGHTQVNATDLRTLRYPSLATLQALGESHSSEVIDQDQLDLLVDKILSKDVAA